MTHKLTAEELTPLIKRVDAIIARMDFEETHRRAYVSIRSAILLKRLEKLDTSSPAYILWTQNRYRWSRHGFIVTYDQILSIPYIVIENTLVPDDSGIFWSVHPLVTH